MLSNNSEKRSDGELTKIEIQKIEKLINKKYPERSEKNIRNWIKKYCEKDERNKKDEKEVVDTILAHERGMTQSTQTGSEIVLAYSLIIAIATIIITTLVSVEFVCDAFKIYVAVSAVIAFMVGTVLLIMLDFFKTRRFYKREFLITILEKWTYGISEEIIQKKSSDNWEKVVNDERELQDNDDKKENKSEDSDTVRANTVTTDVVGGENAQEINEENKSVTLQQKLTEIED